VEGWVKHIISLLQERMGICCLKKFLAGTNKQQHNNTAKTTQRLSVGLADRQHHCAIAHNVCLSAVTESPNLLYERWIRGEHL